MATSIELVPFESHQITTVRAGADVFVVMKPIVSALGLDWNGQYQRINRHPALKEGMCITHVPSTGGEQEAVTLKLEQFQGWLVTLHPERVRDPLKRELILSYQRRAFRVLFDHFHSAAQLPAAMPIQSRIAIQNQVLRLTAKLQHTRNRTERRVIHAMIGDLCRDIGMAPPAMNDLGFDAPHPSDAVAPFWAGIAELKRRGVVFNHSRTSGLLAINRTALAEEFKRAGITLKLDTQLGRALRASDPRYIAAKTVNSRLTGGGIHCWVFTDTD
ncbi:phage antirepressor N-terminal domain-containing protein [uncultured Sphingomonas sp.]|uniref:phage antirepressor N-terminal domain-containing protein n=1 Tax=uncultured Sphingomonas sp. TaxID=158754 RepID=UPI0025910C24|nr:phage antirepressor N-terminal domain-containing protein [uncultured Sphingomonas sp.]